MIPRFPSFKPVELADREEVGIFVSGFPPYSDFNFLSLFCWDTRGMHALSRHHGNLVVRLSDYVTGHSFYTFLGVSRLRETTDDLVELAVKEGLKPELRLVPGVTVLAGGSALQEVFQVEEDPDSHDYLLDVADFLGLKGRIYKNKRRHIAAFREEHPDAVLETLDVSAARVRSELQGLWERWVGTHDAAGRCNLERAAFVRVLDHAATFDLRVVGLRLGGKLAGFNLNEAVHDGYSMGHYGKTDRSEDGMSDLLEHESARVMAALDCTRVNIQQDLGLEGLRAYKRSLRLSWYLRKYTVRPRREAGASRKTRK